MELDIFAMLVYLPIRCFTGTYNASTHLWVRTICVSEGEDNVSSVAVQIRRHWVI